MNLKEGLEIIKGLDIPVRFLIEHKNNEITFTTLQRDQWALLDPVLRIFNRFPILMGDYNYEFSYIQIKENLPILSDKPLLPTKGTDNQLKLENPNIFF